MGSLPFHRLFYSILFTSFLQWKQAEMEPICTRKSHFFLVHLISVAGDR